MNLVKWSAEHGGSHVDHRYFARMADEPHVYSFTTRHLVVPAHAGQFSLKLVLSGEESYEVERSRTIRLRPGLALLVEAGRRYASSITASTESLSIFLPDRLADEAVAMSRLRALADVAHAPRSIAVDSVPFRYGRDLAASVADLLDHVADEDVASVRAAVLLAVSDALRQISSTFAAEALRGVKRRAAREEMLTRVLRARDRILDEHGAFDLEASSATACLSRFHFLRLFRAAFGETPMRFARRVRLHRAAPFVARGDFGRAMRVAGYSNVQAFRRAWRRNLQRTGDLNSPGSSPALSWKSV